MARARATSIRETRVRGERLGFRVEGQTKALVERAARLERRSLTDFCVTALTETAERVIERHEALMLSERDRAAFFEALMAPPAPNAKLRKALRLERERLRS
ncbi:MAG TPA: DUF1778 domain-containing protein [Polyangiaceae bacterium]